MPDRYLSHWNTLRLAFVKLIAWDITVDELAVVRNQLSEFVSAYEQLYCQRRYERISCITSNIHGLLHLTDYVELLGPSHCHWSFPMERVCGMIQPLARSKLYIDESISNGLIFDMYLQMAPFCRSSIELPNCIDIYSADRMDEDEDDEASDADEKNEVGGESNHETDGFIDHGTLQISNTKYKCKYGMLVHPAVKLLSKSQLGKLRRYYANLYGQDLASVSENGVRFKKFIPEHEEFAVGSVSGLRRNDKVRSNALIRYSLEDMKGRMTQHYGQVLFYFHHRYESKDHFLAFVQSFKQVDEVYGFPRVFAHPFHPNQQSASGDKGPFEIIDIEGIDGLIGMLKADERSRQWWILNRENQATFDLVVRDEYVNN